MTALLPDPRSIPLTLWIVDCSCSCGNRWTHSYETHINGGTPTEVEILQGLVLRLIPTKRHFNSCFRCAPLGLGLNWEKPQEKPQPVAPERRKTKRLTVDELDDGIF